MRVLSRNCLLLALFMGLYACGGAGNRAGPAGPPQHHVDLQWSPGSNADVTYNAYRSLTSGGPYVPIATSLTGVTYSDWTVKSGTTYYYVVTAVDSQGRESTYSGEATATVS
jgi:fibronectin type 3 domain-containing protein